LKKKLILFLFVILLASCSVENPKPLNTAFVVIHLEPGEDATTTAYPEQYWPTLVSLVEKANEYNIKLTLLFNPQWGTYILQDPEKLELLRFWEANGHEIGVHHHGPSYGKNWDGYTNQQQYKSDPEYLGDMDDFMNLMNQLPASGKVLTGGIAAEEDKPYDWPEGIIYSTEGVSFEDLINQPAEIEVNNHKATQLTHAAYYAVGKQDVTLKQIASATESSSSGDVMGIVFHERNYGQHKKEIEDLFKYFQENNIQVKAVKEILSNY
jgi:hypothetical protein